MADALAVRLRGTPEKHGQPLRGTLRGYWKLRVGDYRVVFKIVADEVWVLAILHRRQVYEDVLRGIGWQAAQVSHAATQATNMERAYPTMTHSRRRSFRAASARICCIARVS